jgi:hypothetical protein
MITLYLQGGNKRVYTVLVDSDGGRSWYLNNMLHREDGPAVERADGTNYWYLNGKRHREDGPAIEWCNGTKNWYLNGKLHREDGPAIESASGIKLWYLNGKELTDEEFNAKVKKTTIIDGVTYKLVKE